jgi:hypothetical protein
MSGHRDFDRLVRAVQSACAALGTVVSIALPAPALADDLGRLFFTPQERQELDRRRASNVVERSETPPPAQSPVTVNGRVTRSGGKTTTWINGVAHDDTYRSRDPARIGVRGRSVKVGETLDPSRGAVTDPLQGGEIRVNPTPMR